MKERKKHSFTTEVGNLLVVWITGTRRLFIAEVTESSPLRMKIQEKGPYAYLKSDDVIIVDEFTEQLQCDELEGTCNFLEEQQKKGRTVASGLKSVGVQDGKIHVILPVTA